MGAVNGYLSRFRALIMANAADDWLIAECASAAYRPPGQRPDSDSPMGIGGHGSDMEKVSTGNAGAPAYVWRVVKAYDERDYCLWERQQASGEKPAVCILAFRGTYIGVHSWGSTKKTASDLAADSAILAGSKTFRNSSRYYECLAAGRRAVSQYGYVHFTGHSLGGRCAIEVYRSLSIDAAVRGRIRCVAFNPGYGPSDAYQAIVGRRSWGDIVVYTSNDDVISLAPSAGADAHRGKNPNVHSLGEGHGMDQYVTLLRAQAGLSGEPYSRPPPRPAASQAPPTLPKPPITSRPSGSEIPSAPRTSLPISS